MDSEAQRPVLIATQNKGKIKEFRRLLAGISAKFVGLDELPKIAPPTEDGATFSQNASIKARFYSRRFGEFALADDSGLVVDALNGAPGVHSARYGGEGLSDTDRMHLLLKNLEEVPAEQRTARFECAIVLCHPNHDEPLLHAIGSVEGRITTEPRGSNGFGYDPVFVPKGGSLTTAQMSAGQKDALSHRGRAIRAVAPTLGDLVSNRKRSPITNSQRV